jgi:1-acyl-sn-glycerol-3-phosphate acyltransferase
MGSTTLRLWRLTIYLAFTLLLMPVQAIGLVLRQRWVATFPRFYHRWCCRILGLRVRRIGRPTAVRPVLFAANHVSYLDIIIFSSLIAGSFVAKREVASWPLFGWLAKLQRSVFIDWQVRSTAQQRDSIAGRLAAGDALILFPEGTSGDGNRVLPSRARCSASPIARRRVQSRCSPCRSPIPGSTACRSAAATGHCSRGTGRWRWPRICGGCWGWGR